MQDPKLGYTIYRSDLSHALTLIDQCARTYHVETNPIPTIPSWVLVVLVHSIPRNSPYHLSRLISLSRNSAELAFWLHTPESWRMAVQTNNSSLGSVLRRPRQYSNVPPEDLNHVSPFASEAELRRAIHLFASPGHRLYNNNLPQFVVISVLGDDAIALATLFRYHYWDLMEYVLPHRWDLVEYLVHAFAWTGQELGTVLVTVSRAPQPSPAWFQYWFASGIAKVPLSCWLDPAWWTMWNTSLMYTVTLFDCYQLQQQCSSQRAFKLPRVRWTDVIEGQSMHAIQQAIIECRFQVQFSGLASDSSPLLCCAQTPPTHGSLSYPQTHHAT